MYVFSKLVDLLPKRLRPAAKAVYPATATAVGVAATWVATGEFDAAELRTAIIGGVGSLLVFAIPNKEPAA